MPRPSSTPPRRSIKSPPPATAAERLRQLAYDVNARHDGDFRAALAELHQVVLEDAELVVALLGEDAFTRALTDFLRLVRASAHGRALGASARDKTPDQLSADERRRRLGVEITGMMGSYLVAGKPLGLCTRSELLAAAAVDRQHAEFKTEIAGLLKADDAVVLEHVTAATVAKIWRSLGGG